MTAKFFLYIIVGILVCWSMDAVDINRIFKKNRVWQARVFYFLLMLALTYLVTNLLYDFYLSY